MRTCMQCGKVVSGSSYKYCSNQCQSDRLYEEYIKNWKLGKEVGSRGITVKGISAHLRHYLIDKSGNQCMLCGWKEINPIAGKVPLEVDHIDGNADNNAEGNLRLLCPNCHSLTPSFRNLNKGRGRMWRREKYLKA